MSTQYLLQDAAALKALAEQLAKCHKGTKFNQGKHQEAGTLVHSFGDLETSFRRFLEEQLPRLVQRSLTESEIHDLLLEIGEEFRHILYHIKDPKFYRYLREE